MTSPPMYRHDLLRWAAAQQAQAEAQAQANAALVGETQSAPAASTQATPPASRHASSHLPTRASWLDPSTAAPRSERARRQRPALPPLLRWASRIDAWPPALWMSLQALALWPVLREAVRRFASEPAALLALLPLSLLAAAATRGRLSCDWPARPHWLAASAVLSLAITASVGVLGWQALACAAALAAGCSWAAFRKPGTPVLPVMGLLVLSAPLQIPGLSHLLQINGISVLPVWLLWLAACTACATALWNRQQDLRFLARLPAVVLAAAMSCLAHLCVLLNWQITTPNSDANASQAVPALLTLLSSAATCAMVLGLMRSDTKRGTA